MADFNGSDFEAVPPFAQGTADAIEGLTAAAAPAVVFAVPDALLLWDFISEALVRRPANTVAPVVSAVTPAPGTPILPTDSLTFTVTDDEGLFRRVMVVVAFPSGTQEVIHDGDDFVGFYATVSSRSMIAGGHRYTVRRSSGWLGTPTLRIWAVDEAGNEATG